MDDTVPFGRSCSACATDGPEAEALLTSQEAELSLALPERRRADFRAGRLAAKRAVCELRLGTVREVCLAVRSGGERSPTVAKLDGSGSHALALSLSIAHRDGRAAAAACDPGIRVGIDLERQSAIAPGHMTYFLRTEEMEGACCAAAPLDATDLWTLKEAAWKALALSRGNPFKALELVFSNGALAELRHDGRRWQAHARLSNPWPGYRVSTVWVCAPRRS